MAGVGGSRPCRRSSSSVDPHITQVATFASGTPSTFEQNGTVRDARGFASSTWTTPPCTAYCTLMSPRTPRAAAIRSVYATTVATTSGGRVCGGITQAESPECTPASSMCSRIPPTKSSVPS